ncbi:Aste57867_11868 [Aphanomyces stellatus]|uniref:Aste57867_11868 protein n=1 Tax=Aphanomyces stellatus TaxID=120398 RepID=A0A485KUK8_9STRA|nr:hypothetical protein As57867_011823 [Aphanomyces stellatus]VFT88723.1 Aste57867_11868 [Aphanomyces stellatus]
MDSLPELKGYLLKKSRQGRYQKRWFEATSHYLTYYKNADSEKLLACIDLWRSGNIQLGVPTGVAADLTPADFFLKIGDQDYLLRAADQDEAIRWVHGLKTRQVKPEGVISDTYSHHEECYNDTSSEVSSVYNDENRNSVGVNARPMFAIDRDEAAAQSLVGSATRQAPPPPPIAVQPVPLGKAASTRASSATPPATAPFFATAPPPKDDSVTVCCGKCNFM